MLLVFGPRSPTYDFGPGHPLTPRRFGPGLDLLRAVGAEPGLAPEPASDDELEWCHERRYIATVKRFSADPFGVPEAGIGVGGDDPPFAGMHDAAAAVAGGSLRAMEAVLRGDVEHAFHPGGGLHHAMRDHASGFCIYDDPALAIARARRDGLRVLYIDLDVHHGDGVQAIHAADPGVLTVSFHESGRYLFPGTGGVGELGDGAAAGTSVNVPLEPGTGEGAWLAAVRGLLPELAAAFGPDVIVSQHGADSHAWDPLAHLLVTTTAMGAAARLVDSLAHRFAGRPLAGDRGWRLRRLSGRATDVEPCLAGRGPPRRPGIDACRVARALGFGGRPVRPGAAPRDVRRRPERRSRAGRVAGVGRGALARDGGGRASVGGASVAAGRARSRMVGSDGESRGSGRSAPAETRGAPTIMTAVDAATWDRLDLAAGVVRRPTSVAGHALILAAIGDGATVAAAVLDDATVVGLAVAGPPDDRGRREILAVGVEPTYRRRGLGGALLATCVAGDDRLRRGRHPRRARSHRSPAARPPRRNRPPPPGTRRLRDPPRRRVRPRR